MNTLAIIGSGGHANVIAETAKLIGWKEIIFFEKEKNKIKKNRFHMDMISEKIDKIDGIIIGIGDNKTRVKYYNDFIKYKKFINIIHPSSIISSNVQLDKNCFISANTVINSRSKLSHSVIVNTGAIIEHDCICKKGVHISPRSTLGGNVIVKELSWVGMSSIIKNNTVINENVIIGAGSLVLQNINKNQTVYGYPIK
jgi:sugar O-acyltransferase (sialic acid O-acetyltransferase NeuD family)